MKTGFTLRELECFLTIAKEKNYTRAAEKLYTSQPALSRTVTRMEGEIGNPLFIRKNRSVELTPAGEILLRHAQRIMQEYEWLEKELETRFSGQENPLRIAYLGDGMLAILMNLITSFLRRYPEQNITSVRAPELKAVQEGLADAALLYFPTGERPDWAESMTLYSVGLSAFLHSENQLAGKESITLADLRGSQLLIPTGQFPMLQQEYETSFFAISRILEHCGMDPARFQKAGSSHSFQMNIVQENMVGILPDPSCCIANNFVHCVPILDCRESMELVAVWKKGDKSPQLGRLRKLLKEPEVVEQLWAP